MISIFEVKPHEVSRDLRGYTCLFYGAPKTGKTTIASKFSKPLLLAFEAGYLTIPGIMALPINKWSEFKQVLKQLKDEKAHEMYENIVVDTVDIAYDLCEKYICNNNGVSNIGDIPYGGGYAQASKEFDECLRAIPQMGFGLVMISHSQDKTFKDETGSEYNQIVPTLANRPRLIVDRMADIIGYAHPVQEEDGTTHTVLFMRGTPRFVAGSRFKHTPDSIEFTYENLVNAIGEAIDKQAKETDNRYITDKPSEAYKQPEPLDFDELMAEFDMMVAKLQDVTGGAFGTTWAPRISETVARYLGKGKKISDCTADQVDAVELIVNDLKEQIGNGI